MDGRPLTLHQQNESEPMSKIYSIQFNAAGLDYVRQVLGTRPFDEVGLLIRSIEQQRNDQDNPPPPEPAPSELFETVGGPAPALNGSAEASAAH